MGRDLIAEDYMLKQITASLIYPEDAIGKKFWKQVYAEAYKQYGTTNIPVNTFNKVWIIPDKAVVYENAQAGTAYVIESSLKVMLEQDYLSLEKHTAMSDVIPAKAGIQNKNDINALGSKIVREIIIPELTREVNINKNFAQLRQVYNSLILAAWYKRKIKESILEKIYSDRNKVDGLRYLQENPEAIYQQYLQAFKRGTFNYIKEDYDPESRQNIPRKYFSGGAIFKLKAALKFVQHIKLASTPILHSLILSIAIKAVYVSGLLAPDYAQTSQVEADKAAISKAERTILEKPLIELYKTDISNANKRIANLSGYLFEFSNLLGMDGLKHALWSRAGVPFPDGQRKGDAKTIGFVNAKELSSAGIKWIERDQDGNIIKLCVSGIEKESGNEFTVIYERIVNEGKIEWLREWDKTTKNLEKFYKPNKTKANKKESLQTGYLFDLSPLLSKTSLSLSIWPPNGVVFPNGVIKKSGGIGLLLTKILSIGVKWIEHDASGNIIRIGIFAIQKETGNAAEVVYEPWVEDGVVTDWLTQAEIVEKKAKKLFEVDKSKAFQKEFNPNNYLVEFTPLIGPSYLSHAIWPRLSNNNGIPFPDGIKKRNKAIGLLPDLLTVGVEWIERDMNGKIIKLAVSGVQKNTGIKSTVIYLPWVVAGEVKDWLMEKEMVENDLEQLYKPDISRANKFEFKRDDYLVKLNLILSSSALKLAQWPKSTENGVLFPDSIKKGNSLAIGFESQGLLDCGIKWIKRDEEGRVVRIGISGIIKETGEKVSITYVRWTDGGSIDWITEKEAAKRRLNKLYTPDIRKANKVETSLGYLIKLNILIGQNSLDQGIWPKSGMLFPNGVIKRDDTAIGLGVKMLSVGIKWIQRNPKGEPIKLAITGIKRETNQEVNIIYERWVENDGSIDWIKEKEAQAKRLALLFAPDISKANQIELNPNEYLLCLDILLGENSVNKGLWTNSGILFPNGVIKGRQKTIGLGNRLLTIGIKWVHRDKNGEPDKIAIAGIKRETNEEVEVIYVRKELAVNKFDWVIEVTPDKLIPEAETGIIPLVLILTPLQDLRLKIGRAILASLQGRYDESVALWNEMDALYAQHIEQMAPHAIEVAAWIKLALLKHRQIIKGDFNRWAFVPSREGLGVKTMQQMNSVLTRAKINTGDVHAWHLTHGKPLVNEAWPIADGLLDGVEATELWTLSNAPNDDDVNGRAWFLWQANRVLRQGGVLMLTAPHTQASERMISALERLGFKVANRDEQDISFDFSRVKDPVTNHDKIGKIKEQVQGSSVIFPRKSGHKEEMVLV